MKQTRSHKVACAAHGCQRQATVKLQLRPRQDDAGRFKSPYPVYACEQHALHWKQYALSWHESVGGFLIQEDYVATLQRTNGEGFVSYPETELF